MKSSTRGRPKLHSPRTKKELRKLSDAARCRINVGSELARWNRFRNEVGATSNEKAAKILLDR